MGLLDRGLGDDPNILSEVGVEKQLRGFIRRERGYFGANVRGRMRVYGICDGGKAETVLLPSTHVSGLPPDLKTEFIF